MDQTTHEVRLEQWTAKIIFGKALVDAYLAQEHYAVYPRVIVSKEIVNGRKTGIDGNGDIAQDKDGYYRIDSVERYLNVIEAKSWNDIMESEQYRKIMDLINQNLNGYTDDKIRQKYIWMRDLLQSLQKRVLFAQEGVLLAGDLLG